MSKNVVEKTGKSNSLPAFFECDELSMLFDKLIKRIKFSLTNNEKYQFGFVSALKILVFLK
jgi:hypothetical protein